MRSRIAPKARLRVARQFTGGKADHKKRVPPGRLRSSEHVLRVVFDAVLLQESDVFLFKRPFLVVLFLRLDITHRRRNLRDADSERAVPLLPCESWTDRMFVHP